MNIYNTVIIGLANYNGFTNLETRSFKLLISAYISKIKGKYIYRLIIKCENSDALNEFLAFAQDKCRKNANYDNVTVVIDKNPNNT